MAQFHKGTDGVYRVHFESLSDLLAQAKDTSSINPDNQHVYDTYKDPSDFNYEYSIGRFEKELSNPPACAAKVRAITAEIMTDRVITENMRKLVSHLADGDELNAGAWIRRELDGWSQTKKLPRQKKVIRIGCNVSILARNNREDLYYRGAAAAALADILEAAGHSVEITLFSCANGFFDIPRPYGRTCALSCTVKAPDAPMDIDGVALALAEIGVFRTVIFAAKITSAKGKVRMSMGATVPLPSADAEDYDVVFDSDILSKEAAVSALRRYTAGFDADAEAAP